MIEEQLGLFKDKIKEHFLKGTFVKLTIHKKRYKSIEVKAIYIKPILLKDELVFNFVIRNATNDITKNYSLEEGLVKIEHALKTLFFSADLLTTQEDIHYLSNKRDTVKIITKKPTVLIAPEGLHDHQKRKLISTIDNVYLKALGVTSDQGKVLKDKADKFKQINKYIEILDGIFKKHEFKGDVDIVDMGSGKGYLTFALYDFLQSNKTFEAHVTGVEFRPNLVESSNDLAQKCGFEHLKFVQGTIETVAPPKMDVLIALHACDTATDEAIFKGIEAHASLIICAPCCHKQIRKAFNVNPVLKNIMKHGILEERQASIVTDSLRALIMELYGYKTKVFEFISSEHTPKNIMIVGEKRPHDITNAEEIRKEINELKQLYGIEEHHLERLLHQVL